MSRESGNEYRDGKLVNGFDYERQVWIVNGTVQMCGHPASMRLSGRREPCES